MVELGFALMIHFYLYYFELESEPKSISFSWSCTINGNFERHLSMFWEDIFYNSHHFLVSFDLPLPLFAYKLD